MPYESACALAGVQPLSARRYELRRRFFRSITQSESCLYNLLSQRRDSEILFRLRRHSVCSIPLTNTKKFDLIFTMPWLNLSNKINKISLTALYILMYIDECNYRPRRGICEHWTINCCIFCIVFVLFYFLNCLSVAQHCIFFSL